MDIRKITFNERYWEYFIPALAVASLLISCAVVSSRKFFWNDELLSFYLLNDPSLPHMLVAWSDKFNQAPPLYFIIGWVWDKIFGSSFGSIELSLRLFSSVTITIAYIMIWTVLRRTYNFWPVTVGTTSIFCLSELVLYHNAELRMYGLFAAVCAFGCLQYDSLNRKQEYTFTSLLINTLAHAAIVLTHLYGILYSTAVLASFLTYDKYIGTFRKRLYLSVLAGWMVLLPLAPLIINQSNNGAKWFYTYSLSEAIDLLTPFPKFVWFILGLLTISALLSILKSTEKIISKPSFVSQLDHGEISLLILSIFFLLVPLGAWIITVTVKPLLNDRYILPTITVSWSILLTYLISKMISAPEALSSRERNRERNRFSYSALRSIALMALTLTIILYPLHYAKKFPEYSQKPGANDLSYGYPELPIAMEAGHDFLPRFYYSPKPSRYFHILDWENATQNVTSAYATGDYVHLNAISTHYSFIQSVQSSNFLEEHDQFLVLNEADQKWFEERVQNNPDYQIQELGTEQGANDLLTMFFVRRKE